MAARRRTGIRRALTILGPGLITGAADDDPSGITTYSQAGAQFQYGLLWTVLLQVPLMIAVQLMSARIGRVSGRNFAEVLAERFPAWVVWGSAVLLVVANTFTAGADIAGVAAGVELLAHISPLIVVPVVTIGLTAVLVFDSYHTICRTLKWLALALVAYVVSGILAAPDWGAVLRSTALPGLKFSKEYLAMFVACFGTTITPYLFVWQSAEEVAEDKEDGKRTVAQRRGATTAELRDVAADTVIGMSASQVIGYFVMIAAGATLFPHGVHNIQSASEAAQALHPIGRGLGELLFSLGLIGTGLLSVPTLVGSSAYMIAAPMKWNAGIEEKAGRAKSYYAVLAAGMLVAGAIAMAGRSAMELLVAAAVLNGILAPPVMVLLLVVSNDRRVLGQHANGWVLNVLGIAATVIMGVSALALLYWYWM